MVRMGNPFCMMIMESLLQQGGLLAQQASTPGAEDTVLGSQLLQGLCITCCCRLQPDQFQLLTHPSSLQVPIFISLAGNLSDEVVDCGLQWSCRLSRGLQQMDNMASEAAWLQVSTLAAYVASHAAILPK